MLRLQDCAGSDYGWLRNDSVNISFMLHYPPRYEFDFLQKT